MIFEALSASDAGLSAVLMLQWGVVTVHLTLEHMFCCDAGICDGSRTVHYQVLRHDCRRFVVYLVCVRLCDVVNSVNPDRKINFFWNGTVYWTFAYVYWKFPYVRFVSYLIYQAFIWSLHSRSKNKHLLIQSFLFRGPNGAIIVFYCQKVSWNEMQ